MGRFAPDAQGTMSRSLPAPRAAGVRGHRVRTRSWPRRFAGVAVVLVGATTVAAIGALVGAGRSGRRAILIDELAVFEPNPAFVGDVGAALAKGGYAMEYVPPQEVSVERLRSLPGDRADLIIVRAHAALIFDAGRWTDDAALFSSEPVDLAHFDVSGLRALDASGPSAASASSAPDAPSQAAADAAPIGATTLSAAAAAALVPVRRDVGADRRPYLGLGAHFIRDHLRGRFRDDAVVVLMGCDTLRGRGLSEAFLTRGARAVIGWNGPVSAAHTDRSTAALLAHYAAHGSVADAVRSAMTVVGPDPTSGAYLVAAVR